MHSLTLDMFIFLKTTIKKQVIPLPDPHPEQTAAKLAKQNQESQQKAEEMGNTFQGQGTQKRNPGKLKYKIRSNVN